MSLERPSAIDLDSLRQFDNYRTVEAMKKSGVNLVRMFKALANANRLQLFVEILEAGKSNYEDGHACFLHKIMERLDIGAPTVSHHLKELVNAELITTDKKGKFVTCRVNPNSLTALSAFFDRSK